MKKTISHKALVTLLGVTLYSMTPTSHAATRTDSNYVSVATSYWASTMAGRPVTDIKPIVTTCFWESAGGPIAESDTNSCPTHPDGRFSSTTLTSHACTGDLAIVVLTVTIYPSCLQAFAPAEGAQPPTLDVLSRFLGSECGAQMDLNSRSSTKGVVAIVLVREAEKWLVHLEYTYQAVVMPLASDLLSAVRMLTPQNEI
jgi:hypothetical protein